MKTDEIKKVVVETINELERRNMIKTSADSAYSAITDRLYDFYEKGAKDYDVQTALKAFENDPYIYIVPLYFAELKTLEQIAELFNCDVTTISRNKKRLCLAIHAKLNSL